MKPETDNGITNETDTVNNETQDSGTVADAQIKTLGLGIEDKIVDQETKQQEQVVF